jgi:mannose-6-phosphate isomerase-like protein (cupin superfamily)
MQPYDVNIETMTKENDLFRVVLFTGHHSQVVVMSLQPGEEIGEEVHDVDQLLSFVEGTGEAVLEGKVLPVGPSRMVCVPAGTHHNVCNTGAAPMKLFTIYAPPEHPVGTVHRTKDEALRMEAQGAR